MHMIYKTIFFALNTELFIGLRNFRRPSEKNFFGPNEDCQTAQGKPDLIVYKYSWSRTWLTENKNYWKPKGL